VTGGRRLALLAVAIAGVLVLAVVVLSTLGGPGRRIETGVVVNVEATGLTAVHGFSIRTADGRTVDFKIGTLENEMAFTPSHLSTHMVTLAPIRVTYVDDGTSKIAVRLEDAP